MIGDIQQACTSSPQSAVSPMHRLYARLARQEILLSVLTASVRPCVGLHHQCRLIYLGDFVYYPDNTQYDC